MARKDNGYGGVSSQTKRGLIESGAMDKSDFGIQERKPVQKSVIAKDPTRQVSQQEYNSMLSKQKAEAEAKYQKYKSGGYDPGKNLGKYLHKKKNDK